MRYIHNWQHAASYPGFIVSGLVDFLGMVAPLPAGIQQVFLALAFFLEGFLMLMHTKHEPLDAVLHWLLGCTMVSCAFCVVLELHRGNASFLISMGRAYSCMMQGAWLLQIGQVLYTDSVAWLPGPGAQMMAPVIFAMVALGLAVALLVLYVGMQWWIVRCHHACYASLPITNHDPHEQQQHAELGDLEHYDSAGFGGEDSANEHSDGSEGQATPPQKQGPARGGPAKAKHQLMLAISNMRSSDKAHPANAMSTSSEHSSCVHVRAPADMI